MVIERDLAELVYQHGCVGQFRMREHRPSNVVLPLPR